jgi:hypothetical protein
VGAMRVSRYAAFTDTTWMPYAAQMSLNIAYTGITNPMVYVQYRDVAGNESSVYTARYRVDVTPPTADVGMVSINGMTITLHITATDDLSGMGVMWLSPDFDFAYDTTVMNYQPDLTWDLKSHGIVFLKFADKAGNFTDVYWAPYEDPMPPDPTGSTLYLPFIRR